MYISVWLVPVRVKCTTANAIPRAHLKILSVERRYIRRFRGEGISSLIAVGWVQSWGQVRKWEQDEVICQVWPFREYWIERHQYFSADYYQACTERRRTSIDEKNIHG